MSEQIKVQVNGESRTCPQGATMPQVLEHLGMNPRLVAVEYNGEILHRQYWDTTRIKSGDVLEVVTIVGGGIGNRAIDDGKKTVKTSADIRRSPALTIPQPGDTL